MQMGFDCFSRSDPSRVSTDCRMDRNGTFARPRSESVADVAADVMDYPKHVAGRLRPTATSTKWLSIVPDHAGWIVRRAFVGPSLRSSGFPLCTAFLGPRHSAIAFLLSLSEICWMEPPDGARFAASILLALLVARLPPCVVSGWPL